MPDFIVTDPQGKKFRITAPEGATQEQALAYAQQQFSAKPPETAPDAAMGGNPGYMGRFAPMVENLASELKPTRVAAGVGETALNMGSAAVATPVAGVAGAGSLLMGDPDWSAGVVNRIQGAMTYQPRTGAGQVMSRVAGAPFEVIDKATDSAGQVVSDVTGSPAAGAFTKGALNLAPALFSRKGQAAPIAATESAAAKAQARGYTLPPAEANPTMLNNIAQGLSGKIKTQQVASFKNQEITNNKVKSDLGIPEGETITPQVLKDIRERAGKVYEKLGKSGPVKADGQYFRELIDIGKEHFKTQKDFEAAGKSPVVEMIRGLKNTRQFDAQAGIGMVKILRDKAQVARRAGNNHEAGAYGEMAFALEEAMARNIESKIAPQLVQEYRAARRDIAKAYTAEKALNESTGNIDANILAAELKKKRPLDGGMKEVAEFARSFQKSAQTPEKMGAVTPYSPLDFATGAITEAASGNLRGAAAMATRAPVRSVITSGPYQRTAGRAPTVADKKKAAQDKVALRRTMKAFGFTSQASLQDLIDNAEAQ